MSQARVLSVEAIERLYAALAKFGPEGQEALATANGEARRALETVKSRLAFWQKEVQRLQEEVNRARADLSHQRAMSHGRRTGAAEQEIALAKAEKRLREAEEKVTICRRWMVHLPDAIEEFEGPARSLNGMLDADLKVSLAKLRDKINALEAYAALAAPSGGGLPPAGATAAVPSGMARSLSEKAPAAEEKPAGEPAAKEEQPAPPTAPEGTP
jgi:chromosome segregation ATPase